MDSLPMVIQAEYRGDFKIRIVFNDGVDHNDRLLGLAGRSDLRAAKGSRIFPCFFLDGGTVAWPNGADIAPETLYERAKSSQAA